MARSLEILAAVILHQAAVSHELQIARKTGRWGSPSRRATPFEGRGDEDRISDGGGVGGGVGGGDDAVASDRYRPPEFSPSFLEHLASVRDGEPAPGGSDDGGDDEEEGDGGGGGEEEGVRCAVEPPVDPSRAAQNSGGMDSEWFADAAWKEDEEEEEDAERPGDSRSHGRRRTFPLGASAKGDDGLDDPRAESSSPPPPPPVLPWMNSGPRERDEPWFTKIGGGGEEGRPARLPFECTGCGKCCKTEGDVYLSPSETESAAALLGLSVEDFKRRYVAEEEVTVAVPLDPDVSSGETGWTVLRHREGDGSCVFLDDDDRCGIYEARPLQCSTYPFWPRIVASREAWNAEARLPGDCPPGEEGTGRYWTAEDGGCEGMRPVDGDGFFAAAGEDAAGVDAAEARMRLEMYERYKRRFPRTELRPVERSEDEVL